MVISASRLGLNCVYIGELLEKPGIPVLLEAEGVNLSLISGDADGDAGFTIPTEVKDVIQNSKALYCSSLLLSEYPPLHLTLLLNCANSLFYDHRGGAKNLTPIQNEVLDRLIKECKLLFVNFGEEDDLSFDDIDNEPNIPFIILKTGGADHSSIMLYKGEALLAPTFKVVFGHTIGWQEGLAAGICFGVLQSLSCKYTLLIGHAVKAATTMTWNEVADFEAVIQLLQLGYLNDGSKSPKEILVEGQKRHII